MIGLCYDKKDSYCLHGLAECRAHEVRLMLKQTDLTTGTTKQLGSMGFKSIDEEGRHYPKAAYLYLDCLQLLMLICNHNEASPYQIRSYHVDLKMAFDAIPWIYAP